MSEEASDNREDNGGKKPKSKVFIILAALGSLIAVWLILTMALALYREVVAEFIDGASSSEKVTLTEIKEIPLGEARVAVEDKIGVGVIGEVQETDNGLLECNIYETESGKPWRLCFRDDLLSSKKKASKNDLP